MYCLETVGLLLIDDNRSAIQQKNWPKIGQKDLILQVIPVVRKNKGGWGQFLEYSAAGVGKAGAGRAIASASSAGSVLDSGCLQQPVAISIHFSLIFC